MTNQNASTLDLIQKGEGLTVEFKRTIDSPYKIARTLASLANTSGGVLLVGVADNRDVIGVVSELREMQKIEKASSFLIEKPLLIRYKTVLLGGKKILRIEVDESEDKPHYAINERGERIIYIRVKDKSIPTNRLMLSGERDAETEKLLSLRPVKTLIQYLKQHDVITVKVLSQLLNISDKRAARLLNDLAEKQVLLKIERGKPISYSLKLVQ